MNKATKKRPDQMLITALKSFKTGRANDTVEAGDTFYMSDMLALALIAQGQCKAAPAGAVPITAAQADANAAAAEAKMAADKAAMAATMVKDQDAAQAAADVQSQIKAPAKVK
jgi:hypothetical protein